jgi:hypothetical protein
MIHHISGRFSLRRRLACSRYSLIDDDMRALAFEPMPCAGFDMCEKTVEIETKRGGLLLPAKMLTGRSSLAGNAPRGRESKMYIECHTTG